MSCALGEFESLAKKAIRGAGYSWGLAEDGARAARSVASLGLPADELLATLLRQTDGQAYCVLQPGNALCCPLCLGPSLCDLPPTGETTVQNVATPLLLAPFLQNSLTNQTDGFYLSWPGASLHIAANGITATGTTLLCDLAEITIAPRTATIAVPKRASRITMDARAEQTLLALAHRTYAPATEESRLAGAGAGLSDND